MLPCMTDIQGEVPSAPIGPAGEGGVPERPRRGWVSPLLFGLLGLAIGAGGVGAGWALSGSSGGGKSFTLRGGLTLDDSSTTSLDTDDTKCAGGGGFDDIREGAAVTVYDAAGGVVAAGSLGAGVYASAGDVTTPCVFLFSVRGVPAGSKFYSVEVSHRGKLTVSAADARAGKFAASLGG